MQLTIAPETSATLAADKTIRCLLDMRYPLPSRQSSPAIAFARQFTEELASAVPAQLSPPAVPLPNTTGTDATPSTSNVTTTTADAQLHGALLDRNRLRVCFDVFLDDCTPEARREADESLARPIHVVVIDGSGTGYRIRRSPMLDARVAQSYGAIREMHVDRGGTRPYFVDSSPPLYVNEIRFDGSLEEFQLGSDAPFDEGEEWELKEVCGHRRAGDGFWEMLVKWKSGRKPTWEDYEDVARTDPEALEEYERVRGKIVVDI